jgi:hypothetical protein
MTPAAWRSVLLTLCAVTALLTVASLVDVLGAGGAPPWLGLWGAYLGASAEPYHLSVLAVDPGGPGDRAGLHQGDLIDIRPNTLVERFEEFFQPLDGRPITFSVRRGAQMKQITLVPGPMLDPTRRWYAALGALGNLWLLLFAALIVWRRAFVPGNLLLSFALVSIVGGFMGPDILVTPWAWVYIVLAIYSQCAYFAAYALWAAYAGCFGRPLSRTRHAAQWVCFVLVGTSIVLVASAIFGIATLLTDPVGLWFAPWLQIPYAAAAFMALVCSVLAIAASRGADRQRAVWSLVPLAVLCVMQVTLLFVGLTLSSYASGLVWQFVNYATIAVVPVVLTYAAVSRRLIDVGFVLNRTAVFAILSTIVIGAFVLIEWAASAWLAGTTHATSAVIGMIVALAIGLSLRYIHRYVDRFVDRVFFRKRHDDEAALRRFAHEASYITDRAVLMERTEREVKEHTSAQDVAILVLDGSVSYASASNGKFVAVSENDPGILALRAWHKPIDLHAVPDSQLRGEFAYPMISRGELVGVLICGAKHDNEVYAPDESDALLTLAHGVGTALGTLSSRGDNAAESARETQALIVQKLDALMSQVQRVLPPSVQ